MPRTGKFILESDDSVARMPYVFDAEDRFEGTSTNDTVETAIRHRRINSILTLAIEASDISLIISPVPEVKIRRTIEGLNLMADPKLWIW